MLGANKCIYFPPNNHDQVLELNTRTQNISLVGDVVKNKPIKFPCKWYGGALASNGFIYFIPFDEKDVLQVDSRHVNEQAIELVENISDRMNYMCEKPSAKKSKLR